MFAMPSILPGIMISRIEESKNSLFCRNCKAVISLCEKISTEKIFIEKFSGRAENFSGNLVPRFQYFLQLCLDVRYVRFMFKTWTFAKQNTLQQALF